MAPNDTGHRCVGGVETPATPHCHGSAPRVAVLFNLAIGWCLIIWTTSNCFNTSFFSPLQTIYHLVSPQAMNPCTGDICPAVGRPTQFGIVSLLALPLVPIRILGCSTSAYSGPFTESLR